MVIYHCESCPRPGHPCHGHRLRHLCGDPRYRDHLAESTPDEAGPATPVPPDVARQVRLSILRNACPHASAVPDCGCDDKICAIGKGAGGRAGREDCYECLEARDRT